MTHDEVAAELGFDRQRYSKAKCQEAAAIIARHCAERERELRELLKNLRWKSIEKDNMEFQCTVTCYEMDAIEAALAASVEGG